MRISFKFRWSSFPRPLRIAVICVLAAVMILWGWDRFMGNRFVVFRGHVTDANGVPLQGVNVIIDVRAYYPGQLPLSIGAEVYGTNHTLSLTTASDGSFSTGLIRARSIVIKATNKDGYTEINDHNGTCFMMKDSDWSGANAPTYRLAKTK